MAAEYADSIENSLSAYVSKCKRFALNADTEDALEAEDLMRNCLQPLVGSSKDIKIDQMAIFNTFGEVKPSDPGFFDCNSDLEKIFVCLFVALIPLRFYVKLGVIEDHIAMAVAFSVVALSSALNIFGLDTFLYSSTAVTSYIVGEFFVLYGGDILMIYRQANTELRLEVEDIILPEPFTVFQGVMTMSYWTLFPEAEMSMRGIAVLNTVMLIMDMSEEAIVLILVGMENHLIYQMSPLRRRWG